MRTFLADGIIVTMNPRADIVHGGILVEDGRIAQIVASGDPQPHADRRVDLDGRTLIPGMVQSHIHGCQTLFRGAADDLLLLDWLKQRIWPMEAAHDEASLQASLSLTALELLAGGTTAMLSMETVRHTATAFTALAATPLRAVVGKCMMDVGDEVPRVMREDPARSLDEALQLARAYPNRPGARLRACLAPRFAVSCSPGLLRDVAAAARSHNLLIHTHGAEQVAEVELVQRSTGMRNLAWLAEVGMANDRLRLAHVIHLDAAETELLRSSGTHVLHCPSSNLKLGSGIAPIHRYLQLGVPVSIGADGAPCNNNLDALREARLAALLQKPLFGPDALPARTALTLATREGARALGMADEIGSIEPGKQADLVEFDLDKPHIAPFGDPYGQIVYAAERADIHRVWVDGEVVVERGVPAWCDAAAVVANARQQAGRLWQRAGLTR